MTGTVITGLLLLAAVAAIIVKMIRDKKNGRQCSGCSHAAGCPASLACNCNSKK